MTYIGGSVVYLPRCNFSDLLAGFFRKSSGVIKESLSLTFGVFIVPYNGGPLYSRAFDNFPDLSRKLLGVHSSVSSNSGTSSLSIDESFLSLTDNAFGDFKHTR